MIITAILNRVPAPYFNVSMVIAGGQEVKGLLMTGLVLLWGLENGLKSMYVSWLLLIKIELKKGASRKHVEDFERKGTWRKGTDSFQYGNSNSVLFFSEKSC